MPTIKDIKISKPTQEQIEQASNWQIWSCDKKEFDWQYTQTEKCLILEGQVIVYNPDKTESVSIGKGDFVVFPSGLTCIWDVKEAIKKHFDFE